MTEKSAIQKLIEDLKTASCNTPPAPLLTEDEEDMQILETPTLSKYISSYPEDVSFEDLTYLDQTDT